MQFSLKVQRILSRRNALFKAIKCHLAIFMAEGENFKWGNCPTPYPLHNDFYGGTKGVVSIQYIFPQICFCLCKSLKYFYALYYFILYTYLLWLQQECSFSVASLIFLNSLNLYNGCIFIKKNCW